MVQLLNKAGWPGWRGRLVRVILGSMGTEHLRGGTQLGTIAAAKSRLNAESNNWVPKRARRWKWEHVRYVVNLERMLKLLVVNDNSGAPV